MNKLITIFPIIFVICITSLSGQENHGFTLEPAVGFGQKTYLFRTMYTPNKKDFFYFSHSNFIAEPNIQYTLPENTRGTFGYRRSIFRTGKESFLYGQVFLEAYAQNSIFGVKAGIGWMQSIGQNLFLDINPNLVYHSNNLYTTNLSSKDVLYLHLPLNLRAFMSFSDFKADGYNFEDLKWRVRKHSFDLTLRPIQSSSFLRELFLYSDINVGYRIQNWMILEAIFSGKNNFLVSPDFNFNTLRYGVGLSIQPYQWKRLLPTAGISLESEYLGIGYDPFLDRKRNTLVSDAYIGLEFKINPHYSWSINYVVPILEGINSFRQLELGTVYQF